MTLTEVVKSRRSVRKFDGRVVARSVLENVIDLALTAPSSKSTRSTRFMVVDTPELMDKISQMRDFGSSFVKNAPCGVLVMGDATATDLWIENAAISATLLQLAAKEAGLGSCWVHTNARPRKIEEPDGATVTDYLCELLPIPEGCRPLCFVALGYPSDPPKPRKEYDNSDKIIWL